MARTAPGPRCFMRYMTIRKGHATDAAVAARSVDDD